MNKISKYFDIKTFVSVFLSVLILYTICVRFLPAIGYKLYLRPIKQKLYKHKEKQNSETSKYTEYKTQINN